MLVTIGMKQIILCLQLTYKELKPCNPETCPYYQKGLQLTYKELKRGSPLYVIQQKHCLQLTYKELKPLTRMRILFTK